MNATPFDDFETQEQCEEYDFAYNFQESFDPFDEYETECFREHCLHQKGENPEEIDADELRDEFYNRN